MKAKILIYCDRLARLTANLSLGERQFLHTQQKGSQILWLTYYYYYIYTYYLQPIYAHLFPPTWVFNEVMKPYIFTGLWLLFLLLHLIFFCLCTTRLNKAECRLMNCSSSFGNTRVLHVCTLHFSHTDVCGARAHSGVDCYPSTGLPKQRSSQQTQGTTPDTSVFSINCHPWHSALSIQHFSTVFLHFHTARLIFNFPILQIDLYFKAAIFKGSLIQRLGTCLYFPFISQSITRLRCSLRNLNTLGLLVRTKVWQAPLAQQNT